MKKCKNIECENLIDDKRVYCSLKCRNIYVNKNLRDYSKVKEIFKTKSVLAEKEYLKNPNICKFCGEIIPFERKGNLEFCNHSCSAKFSNKLRKGTKHNLSEEGRKVLIDSANKNFKGERRDRINIEKEKYNAGKLNTCINCNSTLVFKHRNRIFCNINCKKDYYSKNKTEFGLYYFLSKFKFNLRSFSEEFNFSLIEKFGWYKAKNNGDNVEGVSRDHMFSVKEGFRKLINPLLLAHPANCELIVNKQNQSKSDGCSLELEKLLEKIKIFEDRYGKYYKKDIKTYIDFNELKEIYMGCVV